MSHENPPSFFKKKIQTFNAISQEEGFWAALLRTSHFYIDKTGWFQDRWIFGRLIELRGNMVRLEGCKFSLNSPYLQTEIKSRFVLGRYERRERKMIRRYLDPRVPVIELGGSIGVVACVTNKRLKDPKKHVVVEANPNLIPLLTTNRDLNGCSFTILNKAYAPSQKEATFYIDTKFVTGGMQRVTGESITVPTVSLAEIFAQHDFQYANLICDIEGGEVELTTHEKELISKKISHIVVEVHYSNVAAGAIECFRQELESVGFRKVRTGTYSTVWVFENTHLHLPFAKN